jgi:hypothetical protein
MPRINRTDMDFIPICPHCETHIINLPRYKIGAAFITFVYACPHCKKIIGISDEIIKD